MTLPNSLRASAVGIDTRYQNFNVGAVSLLQQRIAIIAQGSDAATYATDKFEITSSLEVAEKMGFGSPAHLAAKQIFPDFGEGALGAGVTVYPLPNESGGTASSADITPTGTQTTSAQYVVRVGGIESKAFSALKDDTPTELIPKMITAINGELDMPVIATDGTDKVTLTAKHKGTTGDDLVVELLGAPQGITFAVGTMSGGLDDPDIDAALAQVGNVWETMVVNQLGTVAHDKLSAFGEGRWGQLVRKPLFALYGSNETDESVLKTYADARKLDRVNAVIPCPGSPSAPWIIAARAAARIAKQANEDPATEYRGMTLDTVVNGKDGEQWNYDQRDLAWKAGVSSTVIEEGAIKLDNTLTFYHPDGKVDPEYGKVIYLVKLQNIIYNEDLIFNQPEWKKAPLIPDFQVSSNPNARKPSDAVAALNVLTDNLAAKAIISDPDFTKKSTTAAIDGSNPNRVNTNHPVKLSGNWDIHSLDLLFGFYLGGA